MPTDSPIEESLIRTPVRTAVIGEAVAGDFTVTGIRPKDILLSVVFVKLTLTEGLPNTLAFTFGNITSEFTITAANTINNAAGTSLVDSFAIVTYLDVPEKVR